MILPAARPPRPLRPTRTPVPRQPRPTTPATRPTPRRPVLPQPVPLPPLPAHRPVVTPTATDAAASPIAATAAAAAASATGAAGLEDLVSPRTVQARFDLDDDELDAVCAHLTAVRVGTVGLTRYRLNEVTALLAVTS